MLSGNVTPWIFETPDEFEDRKEYNRLFTKYSVLNKGKPFCLLRTIEALKGSVLCYQKDPLPLKVISIEGDSMENSTFVKTAQPLQPWAIKDIQRLFSHIPNLRNFFVMSGLHFNYEDFCLLQNMTFRISEQSSVKDLYIKDLLTFKKLGDVVVRVETKLNCKGLNIHLLRHLEANQKITLHLFPSEHSAKGYTLEYQDYWTMQRLIDLCEIWVIAGDRSRDLLREGTYPLETEFADFYKL